jgi:hypothetical protein
MRRCDPVRWVNKQNTTWSPQEIVNNLRACPGVSLRVTQHTRRDAPGVKQGNSDFLPCLLSSWHILGTTVRADDCSRLGSWVYCDLRSTVIRVPDVVSRSSSPSSMPFPSRRPAADGVYLSPSPGPASSKKVRARWMISTYTPTTQFRSCAINHLIERKTNLQDDSKRRGRKEKREKGFLKEGSRNKCSSSPQSRHRIQQKDEGKRPGYKRTRCFML